MINNFLYCNDLPTTPQILIIGSQEYNTDDIKSNIINVNDKMLNTTYLSKCKYKIKKQMHNEIFDNDSIEKILCHQMETPDELYCNKFQVFDECINIFDRCFTDSEFDKLYFSQFEKLFKYAKKYKIINMVIINYMYESFKNNDFYKKFDCIFCVNDKYGKNVDKLKEKFEIYSHPHTFLYNYYNYANELSALVIKKTNETYTFYKVMYTCKQTKKNNECIVLENNCEISEEIKITNICI